ncbi:hypoxanthine phosphoribosyltransferase [Meiothermus ruber]|uniref:Hypoxanthine phosphoribosyltransferase n=2 Tax=Meiothermus ruber (strain ATCC 35948 / DSM 1279 / VKM B-1258 / 21) TaxID=504728 RepID=A0A806CNF2_MEIRD|nr:hypoxanthine phosphoribosyltransferase [Meiothermus ruber]ADD29500.1 hypoxanthine phosphoribosyltransferase [Meiothermus ruber DSM 1279]MCL6529290.1 hypoxanthine phosphoribosyltransferase [Meiothermus ruber]MCX7802113.1 hypoxanthine phosphoribosyltransferase [Meiothermus ruber]GAO76422.1 hypoxanthine phosphoribosyltransferase [Meiothermus ruber H328]
MNVFRPGNGKVQIGEAQIAKRIRELGEQIRLDYQGQEPHLICVLNGAFIFMADLVRAIDMPLTMDFLAVSSYGNSQKTSGEVELIKDLRLPIAGRHVIVVEDIVDTGITINYLLRMLEARQPASLKIAALLSKPSRRQIEVPIHYLGFEIEDAFVYGYGLDRSQFDRNLPFITSQA